MSARNHKKSLVALVGRPNVGKSTLFNRLIGKRVAIVQDEPGVTRDRNYAPSDYRDRNFVLVDTGGFIPSSAEGIFSRVRAQTETAIEEADVLILVLDAKEGLTPIDEEIYALLRKSGKPVFCAVNKTEGKVKDHHSEFYRLGVDCLYPISADHGYGVDDLMEAIYPLLVPFPEGEPVEAFETPPKVAVLGRPNVGKSTLINALLREERLVTSEVPGTTHDPVDALVEWKGRRYLFVDTAGIRRRSRIERGVERFSVGRAYAALARSEIALLLLDGVEGVTDQDAKIGSRIADEGKGCILLVNKWDIHGKKEGARESYLSEIANQLPFLSYAPVHFLSALKKERLPEIFQLIGRVYAAASRRIQTGELNRFFESAIGGHPPPIHRGRATRIYYITQTSVKPPTFVAFVNSPRGLGRNYLRYMENQLRRSFDFEGTPIRILIRKRR
ncbi:MAG TPA: ribosome biogenesis GTPase Der [Nitrospiria bacterium]|nr:ribosome biogenesis GTPase Der [Nitrospiria bacterium]